jgi:3-deoxy-manno-octulosonate cytidylyltransferase (CMP-KDO synthetase)
MKAIALIPARIGATRFPRKMLADLKGKPVIRRTYENIVSTGLFAEVIVVTDSDEIQREIHGCGGRVFRSTRDYESGTDRIAEAARDLEADVFVNVQGDEPFVNREALAALLELFDDGTGVDTLVGSLMQPLDDPQLVADPNYVKVVTDFSNKALLFSRSPIPYMRDNAARITFYEHIGVYAFRKEALMDFTAWPVGILEAAEKIECLRFLEMGVPIWMAVAEGAAVEIDTPEDIGRAEAFMERMGLG